MRREKSEAEFKNKISAILKNNEKREKKLQKKFKDDKALRAYKLEKSVEKA